MFNFILDHIRTQTNSLVRSQILSQRDCVFLANTLSLSLSLSLSLIISLSTFLSIYFSISVSLSLASHLFQFLCSKFLFVQVRLPSVGRRFLKFGFDGAAVVATAVAASVDPPKLWQRSIKDWTSIW